MNAYIDQLTSMHMNTQRGHTSPHKAVMLLLVVHLINLIGKTILPPEQRQYVAKRDAVH